ncbi:MAG: hypothetical protein IPJ85_15855 [Flavobacteriales bacterium]|nr:hypothetical protein [Flavobacteriales bacterium]
MGKHLTCGIVDEHSHIAISRGVNEGSHHISSEVRIGDVVNPDDVNLYRNLAGGVTTVQQLHGSANVMGGQSAVIKLRWGHSADSLLLKGARPHQVRAGREREAEQLGAELALPANAYGRGAGLLRRLPSSARLSAGA